MSKSSIISLTNRLMVYLADTSDSNKRNPLFSEAPRLREQVIAISKKFDEGRPAEPPSRERAIAIQKLRRQSAELTQKDWIRVAWGLCDRIEHHGLGMIDDRIMLPVIERLEHQKNTQSISRKFWFGLLHSYFSFDLALESIGEYWRKLRDLLLSSLPILVKSQARPKSWVKALLEHKELLTDKAGQSLVDDIFDKDMSKSIELLAFFSIPESSWLWKRVIQMQIEKLKSVSEKQFFEVIPKFIKIADDHLNQTDSILIGLLDRYEQSSRRDQSHQEIKDFALAHWKNPQIKSSSRWGLVSDSVRKMVSQWFAKEDLLLFFSLLQDTGSVDKARLNFWLNFVDQIDFTRIVMGNDALFRRDSDFVDFRNKNKGRFSELVGGATSNNAFIMRIGQYYFVEFSETGNACYIYDSSQLSFDPEAKQLRLLELKNKRYAIDRILHLSDWVYSALMKLGKLGIHQNKKTTSLSAKKVTEGRSHNREVVNLEKKNLQDPISAALELAARYDIPTSDERTGGGVFWVVHKQYGDVIGKRLINLGFKFSYARGYWLR